MISITTTSFNCTVCKQELRAPVTLSCGFTICLKCLPNEAEFQKSTFVCPAADCHKESHLFGPDLYMDHVIQNILTTHNDDPLFCSISSSHLLSNPVTNHCGHTFCKLCLLEHRVNNDSCIICQKRLPSFQYIQQQPINQLINNVIINSGNSQQLDTNSRSFSYKKSSIYNNIPIYLSNFAVLPTQKLRLPFHSPEQRLAFQQSLVRCNDYQCLCLAIINKDKGNMKNHFGTIVKVTSIEQRETDMLVDMVGVDRFQVISVNQENDELIMADLVIKFEEKQVLYDDYIQEQITPPLDVNDDQLVPPVSNIILPSSPPHSVSSPKLIYDLNPMSPAIKLSNSIHDFISELAHSTPSTSFSSTVEGLLGPVWLDSVQGLQGKLPPADHAVALCWWAAVVLPVSNHDRYHFLETLPLTDRLNIILSWIYDLKSQWGNCRRIAMNSASKVWP